MIQMIGVTCPCHKFLNKYIVFKFRWGFEPQFTDSKSVVLTNYTNGTQKPTRGIESRTYALQVRRSTTELYRREKSLLLHDLLRRYSLNIGIQVIIVEYQHAGTSTQQNNNNKDEIRGVGFEPTNPEEQILSLTHLTTLLSSQKEKNIRCLESNQGFQQ